MSTAMDVPSNVVIRDLLLTMWFKRWRILLIVSASTALAVAVALQIQPKYQSTSSMLVLLGPEYGFRPTAGQQFASNFNIGPEELLRTEADILNSNDLHDEVIRQFGVGTLYPALVKPPGWLAQQLLQAKAYLYNLTGAPPPRVTSAPDTDVKKAARLFEQSLGVGVDKKSNVIHLSFQHPDAALAAGVLRVLETDYFKLRVKLFADKQAGIVNEEEAAVAAQLRAADQRLASYKTSHDIANFAEREKVLLTQQGMLEDQLAKAETAIATEQARLTDLTGQLQLASGAGKGKHPANAAGPLQGVVEAYRRHQQQALTTYRGSPAYDLARTNMMKAEEELAKMRSTEAFKLQQEVDKTQADLRGHEAAREAIHPQLAQLAKEIAAGTAEQQQLHALERTREIIEENYKSIAKLAKDRSVIEAIDAQRQPSVRIVEAPQVPYLPQPIRKQIVAIGLLAGVVLAVIVSLLSIFFRAVYLRPEALEADTGLAVLAVIPDQPSLGVPALLVSPK